MILEPHEVAERRNALKLSQARLAALSGVPESHISKIEGGLNATAETLKKLTDALQKAQGGTE